MSTSQPQLSAASLLKSATGQAHQDIEERLIVGRPTFTEADIRAYAVALHQWMSEVSPKVWAGDWIKGLDVDHWAGPVDWLRADVYQEGHMTENLPVPPLNLATDAQRMGAAYVIAGSQMGNQILHKRMQANGIAWQSRYLAGYGKETRAHWEAFRSHLDSHLDDQTKVEDACASANATFRHLESWFAARGVTVDAS